MFLKNKNIIFKIRRSKVTDYAALREGAPLECGKAQNLCICFEYCQQPILQSLREASEIIYHSVPHLKPFVFVI